MPSLLDTKWVFFKEDSRTHEEVFLSAWDYGLRIEETTDIGEAIGFDTADEAYRFAFQMSPALDDWRVGLREIPQ